MKKIFTFLLLILSIEYGFGQIGNIICEENFYILNNWIRDFGTGIEGWGNGPLIANFPVFTSSK